MIVVSNSSPLVALAAVNQARLLQKLYERVLVPEAVWQEVIEQGANKPGTAELSQANWLERRAVTDKTLVMALQDSLDLGESEAIALALDARADLLLMDERLGRRAAQRLGLRVTGVLSVLVEAKHKDQLSAIKPVLDQLRDEVGFRLSEALYQQVLEDEGETA